MFTEKVTTGSLLPEVGYIIPQSGVSHMTLKASDICEMFQWKSEREWLSINHVENIGNCHNFATNMSGVYYTPPPVDTGYLINCSTYSSIVFSSVSGNVE